MTIITTQPQATSRAIFTCDALSLRRDFAQPSPAAVSLKVWLALLPPSSPSTGSSRPIASLIPSARTGRRPAAKVAPASSIFSVTEGSALRNFRRRVARLDSPSITCVGKPAIVITHRGSARPSWRANVVSSFLKPAHTAPDYLPRLEAQHSAKFFRNSNIAKLGKEDLGQTEWALRQARPALTTAELTASHFVSFATSACATRQNELAFTTP